MNIQVYWTDNVYAKKKKIEGAHLTIVLNYIFLILLPIIINRFY
jgi:hypothetical protein